MRWVVGDILYYRDTWDEALFYVEAAYAEDHRPYYDLVALDASNKLYLGYQYCAFETSLFGAELAFSKAPEPAMATRLCQCPVFELVNIGCKCGGL